MGPQIERVVDVSVSPPNDKELSSEEEEKCIHLNAQATNVLFSVLSEDVFKTIMPLKDAHLIWTTLKERYDKSKCDDVLFLEEPFEECSTSSPNCEEPQVTTFDDPDNHPTSTLSTHDYIEGNELVSKVDDRPILPLDSNNTDNEIVILHCVVDSCISPSPKYMCEDDMDKCSTSYSTCGTNLLKGEVNEPQWTSEESTSPRCSSSISKDHAFFMGKDGDFEFDHLSKKDITIVIKLMEIIKKQQACLIKKNEEIMSLTKEHKKLKDFRSSLIMRYKKLESEFACATNSIVCVASLEKQNQELKSQLEEITIKYVDLQERHDELLCSHDNLVDSHAMLEVAHEAIITTVKSYEPHVQVDLITCTNTCCSKENLSPSTTCDLDCVGKGEKQMYYGLVCIAQPSQDNREGMVNKLEKGSTVVCTKIHQRDIKSINAHTKGRNQKMIKSSITCFKYKKVGHHVRDCPWKKGNKLSKKDIPRIKCFKCTEAGHFASRSPCTLDEQCKTSSERQTGNKQTEKQYRSKSRLCYNCWAKGHIGKNCPKGNIPKPSLSFDYNLLRNAKNDICATRVICSPHTSPQAIWVPKSLVTNLYGPNVVGDQNVLK
nr:Putative nucleic acid binding protein [Oryza sativa Japonica Group]